jgi:DNA invertase Pin-like site-specific DNA recombinase
MKYLYMRASTNETKQSLQRQEKFGRDNNIPEANWFKEFASGANNDRIELNRLLSMVKENDEIYAIDPSRVTRSLKFMMELLDLAKEKKIKLVMGDFVLDCTGEISVFTQGQLMMLGLINEIQRLLIVSAVKEGLAASREKGIIGGRPRTSKENIPDIFYKYYPMYKNGQLNKMEFSKITGLSRSSIYKYIDIVEN